MSIRHGLITKTFDILTYEVEEMDKTGKTHLRQETVLRNLDLKAIREMERRKCAEAEKLLLSARRLDVETVLYGMTRERFVECGRRLETNKSKKAKENNNG